MARTNTIAILSVFCSAPSSSLTLVLLAHSFSCRPALIPSFLHSLFASSQPGACFGKPLASTRRQHSSETRRRPLSSLVPTSAVVLHTGAVDRLCSFLLCSFTPAPLHTSLSPLLSSFHALFSVPPAGTKSPFALVRNFTHSLPFLWDLTMSDTKRSPSSLHPLSCSSLPFSIFNRPDCLDPVHFQVYIIGCNRPFPSY